MYHRVLLKISGEALSSEQSVICRETVLSTVNKIKAVRQMGIEIGIVVGGGNIMRGRSADGMERNRADHMGMLATAINSLALQDALEAAGVPCVVQSAVDMDRFCEPFTARGAKRALSEGKVVIFACGSGCPFFSTDTAAALRAAEIGADALLLAKNIDAILSADPKVDPERGTLQPHQLRPRGGGKPACDRPDRDYALQRAEDSDSRVCARSNRADFRG